MPSAAAATTSSRALEPAIAHEQASRAAGRDLRLMGDEEDGGAAPGAEREHALEHAAARGRIEVARGLVGEKERGIRGQRPGESDALLLAAGKLGGIVGGAIREAHLREQFARAGRGIPAAEELERQGDVFERGEVGKEVEGLEQEADVTPPEEGEAVLVERREIPPGDFDAPAARPLDAGDHGEESGLACAGGAGEGDRLAALDLEIDSAQDRDPAGRSVEFEMDVTQADHAGFAATFESPKREMAGR